MVSRLHSRLGTAGFVLAIVALVAAVAGTAFAASGLTGKEKKEVKKIAKSVVKTVVGPTGAPGSSGAAGAAGPKGDPWTAGGTLPSGATETGSWGGLFEGEDVASISFSIPLVSALDDPQVKKVNEGESPPAQCDNGSGPASSGSNPEADPGFLCVYVTTAEGEGKIVNGGIVNPADVGGGTGAGRFGASVLLEAPGSALVLGSFAVTAP